MDKLCDITVCVSANGTAQKKRVMARRRISEKQFKAILKRQMSDAEKRKRADIVFKTDAPYAQTKQEVAALLKEIKNA